MWRTIAVVMLVNAALFAFGATQHVGIAIGPFDEPVIVPAAIVESLCGLALILGSVAAFRGSAAGVITGNLVAIAGVVIGIAALAMGRGPRTASNDLYHRIMLGLAALALVLTWVRGKRVSGGA